MSKRSLWVSLCLALCAVVCMLVLPGKAYAATPGSLTVHFEHKGAKVRDVATRVYLVAKWDAASPSHYTYVDDFSDTGSELPKADVAGKMTVSAAKWDAMAKVLEAHVSESSLKPTQSGSSDANGDVTFADLDEGLYLVLSDPTKIGDQTYGFSSSLVAVPGQDAKSGKIIHAVTINPKGSVQTPPSPKSPPSSTPPTSPSPTPSSSPTPGKLAKTGETWLPIIPFVIAGIVLVALGWKLHNGPRNDDAKG